MHLSTALSLAAWLCYFATECLSQGFYDSCDKTWVLGLNNWPQFMAAACPDSKGVTHYSELDLNDCVGNSEGVMAAQNV